MNAMPDAHGDRTVSIRDVDYTVNPAVTILEITLNEKIELRKL
jgi:hypothetical protein